MHIETDSSFDLQQLADEIAAAVGRDDVVLSGRQPGQSDGEGGTLPGVVVAPDDLDEQTVRDLLAAHQPQAPPDPDRELREAIETASTLAELKAALTGVDRPARVAARQS